MTPVDKSYLVPAIFKKLAPVQKLVPTKRLAPIKKSVPVKRLLSPPIKEPISVDAIISDSEQSDSEYSVDSSTYIYVADSDIAILGCIRLVFGLSQRHGVSIPLISSVLHIVISSLLYSIPFDFISLFSV